MQDDLPDPKRGASADMGRLALRTLDILARDQRAGDRVRAPLETYLDQMKAAVLDPNKAHLDRVIAEMRRALISPAEICEGYVPVVARRLGICWVEDSLDFRAVSIGSARLQSLLWALDRDSKQRTQTARPETLLVVVPQGCQHTLGATVLTGQLRRAGLNVHLGLDLGPEGLTEVMQSAGFAAVLISASARESLDSIANLVQTARQSQATTPVLIGGNILEQMADIKELTGADLATADIRAALDFCGLGDVLAAQPPIGNVG